MKFSIGDKVIFKHTDNEGVIVAYISKDMVEVDVAGVTFPAHVDEIDHPYLKWFTEKKPQQLKKMPVEDFPVEKEKLRKPRLAKGVYLSFLPVFKTGEMEDIIDELKIYLINELPKNIHYRYDYAFPNRSGYELEGKLHAFGHVHLHTIPYDDMNDQPRFNWSLDDLEDADMAPASGQLRIRGQKLFQYVNEMLAKNEPSFNVSLIDDFSPPKAIQKEIGYNKKIEPAPLPVQQPPKPQEELPKYELDLHIENLLDNIQGMSNAEIILYQLSTLKHYLRLAINHRQGRMVIIHGLGKGKLRDEVHYILSETPEVKRYTNDWHGRYGFGATEVLFEY